MPLAMGSEATLKLEVKSANLGKIILNLEMCELPQIPSTVIQTGVSPSFPKSAVTVKDVPYFLDATLIADILIKILFLTRKVVHVFVNEKDLLRRQYFAVFSSVKHAEALVRKVRRLDEVQLETSQLGGNGFFCREYQQRFETNPAKVKEEVSEWLREFAISEQRQKKSALLAKAETKNNDKKVSLAAHIDVANAENDDDGGGWQVVTSRGKKQQEKGVEFTHDNQKKSILLERRRTEKKRMMNFYKQHVNSKKDRQMEELREKFARDKLIVSRMKNESRKFNPTV